MIGQYLSNTNEIGTIHILQKLLELNKAFLSKGKVPIREWASSSTVHVSWLSAVSLRAYLVCER